MDENIMSVVLKGNGDMIEADYKQIPLTGLRQRSRLILSKMLNTPKILPSDQNLPRDWRGVAYLAGLSTHRSDLTSHPDAIGKVLQLWNTEGDKKCANFHTLQEFLRRIDRWDVIEDIKNCLAEDAENYLHSIRNDSSTNSTDVELKSAIGKQDDNILTLDDVSRAQEGLPPQLYDAFVLFSDNDIDFATELIERMQNFGFKLCVKERDLIGGVSFEHEAILRLISERCNRLIVIVSPSFLESPANAFFVNFAQALGIEQGRRKIVPCLYQKCILPPTLNFYFLLNYQRSGKLWNFWDKLRDSIQSTPSETVCKAIMPCATITEVKSSCKKTVTIQSPADSAQCANTPIKAPRKKNNKLQNTLTVCNNLSKTDAINGPTENICNAQQTSSTDFAQQSNEARGIYSNSVCDTYNNSLKDASSSSRTSKENKWYKKILKPNFNNLNPGDSEKSTKRKWFKKKLAVSS